MARCRGACDCPDCTTCNASFADSDCFTVDGTGSAAAPFSISPNIDPDPANLLVCTVDGLGAFLPALITEPPRASMRRSSAESVASGVEETITFTSETYDSAAMVDIAGAPARMSITEDGLYIVHAIVVWEEPTAAAYASCSVYNMPADNNVATDARYITPAAGSPAPRLSISGEEELDAGTYLEVRVFQNTGNAVNITGVTLTARRVAPKV